MKTAWRDGDRSRTVELEPLGPGRWRVRVDESEFEVTAVPLGGGRLGLSAEPGRVGAEVTAAGERRFVRIGAADFVLEKEAPSRRKGKGAAQDHGLEAPMPGAVTRVMVAAGDDVTQGQPLVALEAMKMEHLIRAPRDGRVVSVAAAAGEMVTGGAAIVVMDEAGA